MLPELILLILLLSMSRKLAKINMQYQYVVKKKMLIKATGAAKPEYQLNC